MGKTLGVTYENQCRKETSPQRGEDQTKLLAEKWNAETSPQRGEDERDEIAVDRNEETSPQRGEDT